MAQDTRRTTTDPAAIAAWFGGEPQPTPDGGIRVDLAPEAVRALSLSLHNAREELTDNKSRLIATTAEVTGSRMLTAEWHAANDRWHDLADRQFTLKQRTSDLEHELAHARQQHARAPAAAVRARTAPSGSRRRESHRGRPGHRTVRSSAASGDSGGDDPPADSPSPRLALATPPRALYCFACLTADRRGADAEQVAS